MNLTIERTLELDAAPERVWTALTDPKELAKWFPDEAEIDLRPGGRGTLTWHEHGSGPLELVDVEPPKRLTWRWAGNDGRPLEEYSTLVEWTLNPRPGGGTTLHLKESGFDSEKHFEENGGGWTHELGELQEYLAS